MVAGRLVARILALVFLLCFAPSSVIVNWADTEPSVRGQGQQYSGTESCRACHEKFYSLWSSSHHAKAMQPFSADFADAELTPQIEKINIGRYHYQLNASSGSVRESGPDGDTDYPVVHVLGGKNIYYFLTPMERGRLQTLPIAYDVHAKKWFDTAKSGVRHFPGMAPEESVHWTDGSYTFNTACYNCHVSQLDTNYDVKTDTYNTRWAEPGINCETCHGPCDAHIRVCRQAPADRIPEDLKILRGGRDFTVDQNNDACAVCHAKIIPLTGGFMPGNQFFDHFDMVTLESADYYADGRDLGENYTFTSWLLSPCVQSGKLSCLHCHTSSGRYRQKDDPNRSCLPCHKQRVENATEHTFHKKDSTGSQCIRCHMPMTTFARMQRSDHSMLPPTPASTIDFQSPNACNLCHDDKSAKWADGWIRKWRKTDYQAPLMQRAGLIDAARRQDWTRLSEILAYIQSKDRDAVFSASLIRLLRSCPNPEVLPMLLDAAKDPSPLVRSSAIASLGRYSGKNIREILIDATGDGVRLVRIKAAAAVAGHPTSVGGKEEREALDKATEEYLSAMKARPDQWTSHYNLGNFYLDTGNISSALFAYNSAIKLNSRAVMPMVNAAVAYSRIGEIRAAEELLSTALNVSPDNAPANFNMGLVKAERKKTAEAEQYLRRVKSNPRMDEAFFSLGVLLAEEHPDESVKLLSAAFEMDPTFRYAYALAFYLQQEKEFHRAENTLRFVIENWPQHADSYLLMADIHTRRNKKTEAMNLLNDALSTVDMKERDRYRLIAKRRSLRNRR